MRCYFTLLIFIALQMFVVPLHAVQQNAQLTAQLLSYFDHLIKKNILHAHNLEHMIKHVQVVNPILQAEADESDEVLVHWKQINHLLERSAGLIDAHQIHDWAQKNIVLLKDSQRVKEEVYEEARDIYRPMKFVPLPAGTYTSSLDNKEFVIESGTEIQDTPVTQWQWVQCPVTHWQWMQAMQRNPGERNNETVFQEIAVHGITIFLQPDHPVHHVSYEQVQVFIKTINELDSEYEYFLPSVDEYDILLKEALGKDWMQHSANAVEENDREDAATAGPFIECNNQRIWGLFQQVWQFTRDSVSFENTNLRLVFGLSHDIQEIPKSVESFLRPISIDHENKHTGFRLARRRKDKSEVFPPRAIAVNWKKINPDELKKWIPQPSAELPEPSSMVYPLTLAVIANDYQLIELLLQCGASPLEQDRASVRSSSPLTVFFLVMKSGHKDIINLFIHYRGFLNGASFKTPLYFINDEEDYE